MDKELMPQILFPQVLAYQNQHSEPFEIIPVNTQYDERYDTAIKSPTLPESSFERQMNQRKTQSIMIRTNLKEKDLFFTSQNSGIANDLSFADTSEFIKASDLRSTVYVNSEISPGIGPR